jgi:hypothetical protein
MVKMALIVLFMELNGLVVGGVLIKYKPSANRRKRRSRGAPPLAVQ